MRHSTRRRVPTRRMRKELRRRGKFNAVGTKP